MGGKVRFSETLKWFQEKIRNISENSQKTKRQNLFKQICRPAVCIFTTKITSQPMAYCKSF